MRSSSRADLGLAALDAIAEGSWVAVLCAAWQAAASGIVGPLGIPAFIGAAGGGVAVGRLAGRRRQIGPLVVVAAATIGWLADPAIAPALVAGDLPAAIVHPAGMLLGLAAWRGTRHALVDGDDLVLGSILPFGLAVLALPWMVGGTAAASARDAFAAQALAATALFAASGLAGIGFARLRALRADEADPRASRRWLPIVGVAVATVVAVTVPTAIVLGVSVGGTLDAFVGPLAGLPGMVGRALLDSLTALTGRPGPASSPAPALPGGQVPELGDQPVWFVGLAVVGAVAVVIGVMLVALARDRAHGRPRPVARPPRERRPAAIWRVHLRPRLALPSIALPRRRRRVRPTTATGAYEGVIAALAEDASRAKATGETPRAHARRLRRALLADARLGLLAADFEIEHYASRALSKAETRRALRRGRAIERRAGR